MNTFPNLATKRFSKQGLRFSERGWRLDPVEIQWMLWNGCYDVFVIENGI
jgi:hypothetical protein